MVISFAGLIEARAVAIVICVLSGQLSCHIVT